MQSSTLLAPLREDIERLEKTLTLLATEVDLATRADLVEELVRESSLLEDTKERALYPFLEEVGFTEATRRMRSSTETVRSAMEPVFTTVHQTVPLDVHLHNPEEFERDLIELSSIVGEHLKQENLELVAVESSLSQDKQERLRIGLESERRHAVARPHPAHNPVKRLFSRMVAMIERRFPDTAAQYHPGRDKLAS